MSGWCVLSSDFRPLSTPARHSLPGWAPLANSWHFEFSHSQGLSLGFKIGLWSQAQHSYLRPDVREKDSTLLIEGWFA